MRRLLSTIHAYLIDFPAYTVGKYLGTRWALFRIGFDDGFSAIEADFFPPDPDEDIDLDDEIGPTPNMPE